MLLSQQTKYNTGGLIMDINFGLLLDIENSANLPKPRLFHSHMSFQYLPRKYIENGYKIVNMNRNTNDRHVYMFLFLQEKTCIPDWTWADYFKLFGKGKDVYLMARYQGKMNPERYNDQTITFYPFKRYKNHNFRNAQKMKEDVAKRLKDIKEFDSWESDVILATFMKSGTHWVHEIISMLLSQQTEYFKSDCIRDMNLEIGLQLEKASQLSCPRLIHTHMPFQYLPKKHIDNGYQIINLNRNPKDRHVSMYLFMQGKSGVPNWTWDDYFDRFVVGNGDTRLRNVHLFLGELTFTQDTMTTNKYTSIEKSFNAFQTIYVENQFVSNYTYSDFHQMLINTDTAKENHFNEVHLDVLDFTLNTWLTYGLSSGDLYGGWFSDTREWLDAKKKYTDNILLLHYEQFIKQPKETVTILAKFLNVPNTEEFIREIVDKCSFEKLKSNKKDESRCLHPEGKSTIFREGKIGGWKNWFTVSQNERFDELYKNEIAGYDVEFIYTM